MNLGRSQISTLKERVAEGGGKVPSKLLASEVLPAIPKRPPTCRAPSGALVCVGLCGFGGWASLCDYRDLVSSNPRLGRFLSPSYLPSEVSSLGLQTGFQEDRPSLVPLHPQPQTDRLSEGRSPLSPLKPPPTSWDSVSDPAGGVKHTGTCPCVSRDRLSVPTSLGLCPRQRHSCVIWWEHVAVRVVNLDCGQEKHACSGPWFVSHGWGADLSTVQFSAVPGLVGTVSRPEPPGSRGCPWSALPALALWGRLLGLLGAPDHSSSQESLFIFFFFF